MVFQVILGSQTKACAKAFNGALHQAGVGTGRLSRECGDTRLTARGNLGSAWADAVATWTISFVNGCSEELEPNDEEWESWRATLPGDYDHVSEIGQPAKFAQALARMVTEKIGHKTRGDG